MIKRCSGSGLQKNQKLPDARVRTLLVDDSPLMLKTIARIVQEAGTCELVGTATNGLQALRYVSMLSPDVVVMDVHMPGLNGIQATRCIKSREHPPRVIIVTSDDGPGSKSMAEQAGADEFVSKDGELRQRLLIALDRLFGSAGTAQAHPSESTPCLPATSCTRSD